MTAVIVLINDRMLRTQDHPALLKAAHSGLPVIPAFIFDETAQRDLGKATRWWLSRSLASLSDGFKALGSKLIIRSGAIQDQVLRLIVETGATTVYATRSYCPRGRQIEQNLSGQLKRIGATLEIFSGSLLLEPEAVSTGSGQPYKVFTPFWRQASEYLDFDVVQHAELSTLPAPVKWPASVTIDELPLDTPLDEWVKGFGQMWDIGEQAARNKLADYLDERVQAYPNSRDDMAGDMTSRLSPHLRFGEISPCHIWASVRQMGTVTKDSPKAAFLRQLGWREFCQHLLFHFPHMETEPLKREYKEFPWSVDGGEAFNRWKWGQTGIPLVDAGMRQLNKTGWMHNRARMITASFLVKHLGISWRLGEAWFWDRLLDADEANNSASWQWVAGCGTDAAPYFRIFNPVTQGERFDGAGEYVRRWVPELAAMPNKFIHQPWTAPLLVLDEAGVTIGETYPAPMIDLKIGRANALAALEQMKQAVQLRH